MSLDNNVQVLLTADTGATVLLNLANGKSTYSVGSGVWFPVATNISGGTTSGAVGNYVFTGGIAESDGVVYLIADDVVSTINTASNKISRNVLDLPEYKPGSGITIAGGVIAVDASVVQVGADGKIPEELLPETSTDRIEYFAGEGIDLKGTTFSVASDVVRLDSTGKISQDILPKQEVVSYTAGSGIKIIDNTISVETGIEVGDIPAVGVDGKLPVGIVPQILEAGSGIKIEGNTISVVIDPTTGEVSEYIAGEGIAIEGNTISCLVWEDLRS